MYISIQYSADRLLKSRQTTALYQVITGMRSKSLILSITLLSFLVPLGTFNFPIVKGNPTSNAQTCPLFSTLLTCDFNYPDFASTAGLTLKGNAMSVPGALLQL